MRFLCSRCMQHTFPGRRTGVAELDDIRPGVTVTSEVVNLAAQAPKRLKAETELLVSPDAIFALESSGGGGRVG